MSGAVQPPTARPLERVARVPRPVCPGCRWCVRGDSAPAPERVPLRAGVAHCGGDGRASPGGVLFHDCEGRRRSGAVPPPTARPLGGLLGSATRVLWARMCGCGGLTLSPWPACPVGAACRGGRGGPFPGGGCLPLLRGASGVRRCPPPRPPVLWSGQPGLRDPCFPGAVAAGVGTQHRPHTVGLRCSLWGWQKGVPGGAAFRRFEGRLWSGASPPPTARPLGVLLGSVTHMPWARVCGCGVLMTLL